MYITRDIYKRLSQILKYCILGYVSGDTVHTEYKQSGVPYNCCALQQYKSPSI